MIGFEVKPRCKCGKTLFWFQEDGAISVTGERPKYPSYCPDCGFRMDVSGIKPADVFTGWQKAFRTHPKEVKRGLHVQDAH